MIEGSKPNDGASRATIVEDVNGDGLDDVVVGAPDADNNGRLVSGTAYVVFGKTSSSTVFLARFDALVQINEGFRIDGPHELALAGYQVGGLGDMNSDGLGDILVSAPFAGASYVVFGKTSMLPVDLRTFHNGTQGDAGFLIDTPAPGSDERYGAATVGDVNGDGIPDIAVALRMQREERKGAWIIFGKANSKAVDVIDLGKAGFRILADAGPLIEGIGDLNQDGLDDVLVGYPLSVVFGKRSSKTVALTDLSGKGYRIRIGKNSSAGQDASGVGDVNGDATPDFIIGAPAASKHGRPAAGSVYVVFGKANSRTITLWDLGGGGYRLDGVEPQDYLGSSVAGPGDINMDGIPDLIMGAPGSHDQRSGAYLLWGGK